MGYNPFAAHASAQFGQPAEAGPPLTDEQQAVIDAAEAGRDVIVLACVGAGKTGTIQRLCTRMGSSMRILYLTYSRLLKADAQERVRGAKVQNYHGIVYPHLLRAGIRCGISQSVKAFNDNFRELSAGVEAYDMIVVDEFQDINEEYAQLLRNLKSRNPAMQVVMVGDLEQKVSANSRLDVMAFAREFTQDPVELSFTASFRMGPQMGELLSQAWGKPIRGVNQDQSVQVMDFDAAVAAMAASDPGDLLALGPRKGAMPMALNALERARPEVFNKRTVYASIRDGDRDVQYGPGSGVFTTFDSAKGMERPVALLFDYDERQWGVRLRMPDADPEVLRNVFLVAASRGKKHVVFVTGGPGRTASRGRSVAVPSVPAGPLGPDRLGAISLSRFQNLPGVKPMQYGDKHPFRVSSCFDFKYAENVQDAFEMLERTRLDDPEDPAEPIVVPRADGLIDLSPVVGIYQEAVYFDGWSALGALYEIGGGVRKGDGSGRRALEGEAAAAASELNQDSWADSLLLVATDTEQARYVEQVDEKVSDAAMARIVESLSQHLPADADTQVELQMRGTVVRDAKVRSEAVFLGTADAVHEDKVWELKFVSELTREMFLQLGLYLVMSGLETGVLWNTRTDERWEVRVPDRERFMHAVVLAVTKQNYRAWRPE